MTTRIQLRRGAAALWTAADPILAEGELAAELDTGRYKIGDGLTSWNALPYSSGLRGETGQQGLQGIQGVPGETGPQGLQGIQGVPGEVTLSGVETLTNKTFTGFTETVYILTGTTLALDPDNGTVQTWTLTANSALTDSLSSGQSVLLGITAGSYSVTWPSVTWAKIGGSGTAPTLTSTGVTWVVLWKVGTTLCGALLGTT